MIRRILNNVKQYKQKIDTRGLSLIEVLIVLAITGFTLIALLNLSTRDLGIEKLNEQQDVANYITSSQMQSFDATKTLAPSCLQSLVTNWSVNKNIYYICHANNLSSIGTVVNGCTVSGNGNSSSQQYWYLYLSTSSNYIDTAQQNINQQTAPFYDCQTTFGSSGAYDERLQVTNVDTSARTITLSSQVKWTNFNGKVNNLSLDQQYIY